MKIITTASYCGTGSSAVTDFFGEFKNCKSLGDYEFRFAQDPDGLSDLEYNLVENNHRLNTSQAIKRYKKLVKRLNATWYAKEYVLFFGDSWIKRSNEYIENITQLKTKTWWHQDQIDHGEIFRFVDRLLNKIYRMAHGHFDQNGKFFSLLDKNEMAYFSYLSEEEFLNITKKYTRELFADVNKENAPFFIVDQLVPPSNIARYSRYFDNLAAFIVDRDPRDIYIRFKSENFKVIPISTVEEFCKWYRITREHRKHEHFSKNVFYLQFEDMIYKYNETTRRMMEFVGINSSDHVGKFTLFNPKISIKGTNLKVHFPQYEEDVKVIERALSEYLYEFPEGEKK